MHIWKSEKALFYYRQYKGQKKKGKKLEKWEEDYYKEHKNMVDLKTKTQERSEAEKEELRELFGFKKK